MSPLKPPLRNGIGGTHAPLKPPLRDGIGGTHVPLRYLS